MKLRERARAFRDGEIRWVQHPPRRPAEGCILEVQDAEGNIDLSDAQEWEALASVIPEAGRLGIGAWNDTKDRTVVEVIDALEQAADILGEPDL